MGTILFKALLCCPIESFKIIYPLIGTCSVYYSVTLGTSTLTMVSLCFNEDSFW